MKLVGLESMADFEIRLAGTPKISGHTADMTLSRSLSLTVWPDWAEIRPVGGIQHFWGGQNFGGADGLFWAEFHLANFY